MCTESHQNSASDDVKKGLALLYSPLLEMTDVSTAPSKLLPPLPSSLPHTCSRESAASFAWYIIRDVARLSLPPANELITTGSPCGQTEPGIKAVRPELTERLHFFLSLKHFTFFFFPPPVCCFSP